MATRALVAVLWFSAVEFGSSVAHAQFPDPCLFFRWGSSHCRSSDPEVCETKRMVEEMDEEAKYEKCRREVELERQINEENAARRREDREEAEKTPDQLEELSRAADEFSRRQLLEGLRRLRERQNQ